mmetsp:Transcript_31176/g.60200  ORF Transcript_31176/g.60200 Transcript_31176/m.60200 type:complete len:82 (-) Transcript_31176:103-348(-)
MLLPCSICPARVSISFPISLSALYHSTYFILNSFKELTSIIKALDKCGIKYEHPPEKSATQSMHEKKRSQSMQLHIRRSSC